MEVLNGLGHGLDEKPCGNALAMGSSLRNILYNQQVRNDVMYKGRNDGESVPDL